MVIRSLFDLALVGLVPFFLLLALLSRIPFIKRACAGKEHLWKVFWLFYVGAYILFELIYFGLSGVLIRNLYTDLARLWFIYIWVILGGISVWRCAFNANRREWGYLARAVVLFPACIAVVSIPFLGFFLLDGY